MDSISVTHILQLQTKTENKTKTNKTRENSMLCRLSPHIHVRTRTQDVGYQYMDFIFEFLVKRRFQRIPTCHIHH